MLLRWGAPRDSKQPKLAGQSLSRLFCNECGKKKYRTTQKTEPRGDTPQKNDRTSVPWLHTLHETDRNMQPSSDQSRKDPYNVEQRKTRPTEGLRKSVQQGGGRCGLLWTSPTVLAKG
uniref:GATA-type domain-containing protein n=1 Tax=Steinernema glaseri TaxID=37863 RepID=A0A1I7YJT0_9BILA